MVYTGKPSRACQTCKTRRIKCDEERPCCGQCKKSGRDCPGYPDEFDLIFRNENAAMARRAKRGSSSRATSSRKSSSSSSSPTQQRSPLIDHEKGSPSSSFASESDQAMDITIPSHHSPASLTSYTNYLQNLFPATLQLSTEAKATSYFFNNFVLVPKESESMRGFLELLVPLYNNASARSPLHDATHAVALSAFGRHPQRNDLLQQARMIYGQALSKVNEALTDPIQAKSDETLLSILLFSLYEVSVEPNIIYARSASLATGFGHGRPARSFIAAGQVLIDLPSLVTLTPEQAIISGSDLETQNWNHHVDGAVALVKIRGTEQFKNPQSYDIFRAVRSMMLTNAIQRQKPVDDFPGERGWLGDDSQENAANRLTVISMDLPAVRSRFDAIRGKEVDEAIRFEAEALLETAQMLDSNLENWAGTLPFTWQPQTVSIVSEAQASIETVPKWPGPQHIYGDVFVSNIMNDYRVSRIFTQSIIMGCIKILGGFDSGGDGKHSQSEANTIRAQYIIQQMVDEICASVPFHMGFDMHANPRLSGQEGLSTEALGAYFLTWPLFLCSCVETVSDYQRRWIGGRLLRIGMTFGLNSEQMEAFSRRNVLTTATSFP